MGDQSAIRIRACDYNYHLDRAAAERRLARLAWSPLARDAHHALAELHETAACDCWREHVLQLPDDEVAHLITSQQFDRVSEMLLATYR